MSEGIVKRLGFGNQLKIIKGGKCPDCGRVVIRNDFRNRVSLMEYSISGLCQVCQDEFFGDN